MSKGGPNYFTLKRKRNAVDTGDPTFRFIAATLRSSNLVLRLQRLGEEALNGGVKTFAVTCLSSDVEPSCIPS